VARARQPGLALAAAACAALACASPAEPGDPVPLAVYPGQGTGRTALAVEISGRDLDAATRADFSRPQGSTVDIRYSAVLELVPGGTVVALQDVTLTPRRTLRATVPAGLPRGVYRLRITDPNGRSGVLAQAFRVVATADSVAAFRVEVLEPPRAGVGFVVALTAVDDQGQAVDGFDGKVSLADATAALSPASAGPFVMGRWQVRATVPVITTGDRITATDALGRAGTSSPFDVVAGPTAALVFAGHSVTAAAGVCSPAVEVELRDVLGHPAAAEADVTAQLQSAPAGIRFFSDPGCTAATQSVTIPAGASRASLHFLAATPGTVTLRAVPAALPSASQDEVVSP
jgi:hypothetical protein